MKLSILLTAALFTFLAPALHAQSQGEMNVAAYKDFTLADRKMNEAYGKLMKSLPDDEARQKLRVAQRAWLAYRDAEAEFEADCSRGGTMVPTLLSSTKTDLTEKRTAELKKINVGLW